jgi:hypothetical protein
MERLEGIGVFSEHAWFGPLDRFEMVKTLRVCGEKAMEVEEIERWVATLEHAELCAVQGDARGVVECLEPMVVEVENCALALFRLGVATLVLDVARDGTLSERGLGALRCALASEPHHPTLAGLIDVVLRIATGVPVDEGAFEQATYPRSSGDIRMLADLALHRPDVRTQLLEARRRERDAAARQALRRE